MTLKNSLGEIPFSASESLKPLIYQPFEYENPKKAIGHVHPNTPRIALIHSLTESGSR